MPTDPHDLIARAAEEFPERAPQSDTMQTILQAIANDPNIDPALRKVYGQAAQTGAEAWAGRPTYRHFDCTTRCQHRATSQVGYAEDCRLICVMLQRPAPPKPLPANLDRPTRAELLMQVEKQERTIYDLREAVRRAYMEDDPPMCPECGSENTEHRKVRYPDYATDKDWDECQDCGHDFNEG